MNLNPKNISILVFLGILISLYSCARLDDAAIIPYDPPGATTETRETDPQYVRIIGAGNPKVWIYNDFDGARYNDFYHVAGDTFEVVIRPENYPINNSAWYAFQLWTEDPRQITIRLRYEGGRHRYHPKFRFHQDAEWIPVDSSRYRYGSQTDRAEFDIFLDSEGLTVAAQELINVRSLQTWLTKMADHSSVKVGVAGYSHQQREIPYLFVSDAPDKNHLLFVFGRQHPPEVPGSLAMKAFLERMLEEDHLASEFRKVATVLAYPLMNPDGVYLGHWRHNAGGVDLNRDWGPFHQPETRAVRDHLLGIMQNPEARLYYGFDFHSTTHDVFYTVHKHLPSWPEAFADRWLEGIHARLPEYEIREEPFGVAPPIVKNWLYHTFGAGAVTYEVGDTTDRELLRDVARAAAESAMEQMLDVYRNGQ